jgi:hypothetical protein
MVKPSQRIHDILCRVFGSVSYARRPVGIAGAAAAPARSAVRGRAGPRAGGVHPHRVARRRGAVRGRRPGLRRARPGTAGSRCCPVSRPSSPDSTTTRRSLFCSPDHGAARRCSASARRSLRPCARRAVFAGHKLRIHYAALDQTLKWRTVDPIGLVTVSGQGYLLATRSGADRTYRLSRVLAAEELAEPAQRPDRVDLDRAWRERSTRFRFRTGGDQVTVLVRVNPARREDLVGTALAIRTEETDVDGWLRLEVTFQDSRHAEWALWRLATDAEALAPQWCVRSCATAPPRSPPATEPRRFPTMSGQSYDSSQRRVRQQSDGPVRGRVGLRHRGAAAGRAAVAAGPSAPPLRTGRTRRDRQTTRSASARSPRPRSRSPPSRARPRLTGMGSMPPSPTISICSPVTVRTMSGRGLVRSRITRHQTPSPRRTGHPNPSTASREC